MVGIVGGWFRPSVRPVLAAIFIVAGCGTHPGPASSPSPPGASLSPTEGTAPQHGSAQTGTGTATDESMSPDQDGNPACAAYDGWRAGPGGAGITVTYWYEGTAPVTVRVRQQAVPDLSKTVDNDVSQRYHDFEFLDVNPETVTEVMVAAGDTTCYVRKVPPS
jgi:hypothetical protein